MGKFGFHSKHAVPAVGVPTAPGSLRKEALAGDHDAQQSLMSELNSLLGSEVHDKLVKGGEEGLSEQTLRRWLVARKWDLPHAAKDLTAHADWRVKYVPGGFVTEESVDAELKQNKTFLQGCDNAGHPLAVIIVNRHTPQNVEMCERHIVYALDAACRLGAQQPGWDGKAVGIFDLSGMTYSNSDVAALRAVFDLLQFHYPERLAKLYLYCAPFFFHGAWKLVAPFIDPVTKSKVQFVSKDKQTAAVFAQHFPSTVLPAEFGGTAEWQPVEKAARALREQAASASAKQQQPRSAASPLVASVVAEGL